MKTMKHLNIKEDLLMYIFNSDLYIVEQVDNCTFCLYNICFDDLFLLNDTGKYLMDSLQFSSDIHEIVNNFIVKFDIDLSEISKDAIYLDFINMKNYFIEHKILIEE